MQANMGKYKKQYKKLKKNFELQFPVIT